MLLQKTVEHIDELMTLALEVAQLSDCHQVQARTVEGLAALPGIALARVWRVRPGDICAGCPQGDACPATGPGDVDCLHLIASAGASQVDPSQDWCRIDGRFRRFPIGWRKVGMIAASGEIMTLTDLAGDGSAFADPTWVVREGIVGFTGHPLRYREQTLGVLGLFTRITPTREHTHWVELFASIAAVAVANAEHVGTIEELRGQLELERDYLVEERARFDHDIIGTSAAMQTVTRQIDMVAPTDATVLITGESGTGKELVATAIHRASERSDGPLVRVNSAAVSPELFESEFFGHAAGSFTGAARDRAGRFQVADGGTIFLDEIGELPLGLQGKLLRVLQEGTYERVGEDETRRCDVRVIAATNRDLRAEVEAGRFRQDLYYRLGVFPVHIPPLRERPEDIPALAAHFVGSACKRLNQSGTPCRLTEADVLGMQGYQWPGNVRELQHVVERGVILAQGGRIGLSIDIQRTGESPQPMTMNHRSRSAGGPQMDPGQILNDTQIDELVRANLLRAIDVCEGRIYGTNGAAALLGIKPTTLLYRLKKYGIRRSWRAD